MYLIDDLETHVITNPYNEGYRYLRVLSGYVSPIFVEHVMTTYTDLSLEITVGMVSHEGIPIWNHQAFLTLVERFAGRLTVSYQVSRPGNHRKVYYWVENELLGLDSRVFLGSANFTRNGFGRQNEILVESTHQNIGDIFADLNVLSCDNQTIDNQISFYSAVPRPIAINSPESPNELDTSTGILSTPTNNYTDFVDLSLLVNGLVPSTSGLNWGHRQDGSRNGNEAYIKVPSVIHTQNPGFFPPFRVPFLLITDDGENLVCTMAQGKRIPKAIHTRESNKLMGAYFRRRLGLDDEVFVVVENLIRYGRTDVRIYKIDDETFYLDFSVNE